MNTLAEARVAERYESHARFRIYTSLCAGAVTAELENISKTGAFMRARYLPPEGETITWVALDETWRPVSSGAGVVRWKRAAEDGVDPFGGHQDNGFGVEFAEPIDLGRFSHEA